MIAGEGRNELGGRHGDRIYWKTDEPGVVESLLRLAHAEGWSVKDAREWRSIRKLRVGAGLPHADRQNVLGLALDAQEAGCDILAFTRDRDNDPHRIGAIEEGIRQAGELNADLAIIGGVAVPNIEGWLLALKGNSRTEQLGPAAAVDRLAQLGVDPKSTAQMVAAIQMADRQEIATDAVGLNRFVEQAEQVLERLCAGPKPD